MGLRIPPPPPPLPHGGQPIHGIKKEDDIAKIEPTKSSSGYTHMTPSERLKMPRMPRVGRAGVTEAERQKAMEAASKFRAKDVQSTPSKEQTAQTASAAGEVLHKPRERRHGIISDVGGAAAFVAATKKAPPPPPRPPLQEKNITSNMPIESNRKPSPSPPRTPPPGDVALRTEFSNIIIKHLIKDLPKENKAEVAKIKADVNKFVTEILEGLNTSKPVEPIPLHEILTAFAKKINEEYGPKITPEKATTLLMEIFIGNKQIDSAVTHWNKERLHSHRQRLK